MALGAARCLVLLEGAAKVTVLVAVVQGAVVTLWTVILVESLHGVVQQEILLCTMTVYNIVVVLPDTHQGDVSHETKV